MFSLQWIPFETRPFAVWIVGGGLLATGVGYFFFSRSGTQRAFIVYCWYLVGVLALCLTLCTWRFDGSWWPVAGLIVSTAAFYRWLIRYYETADYAALSSPPQKGMYDIHYADGQHTPNLLLPRPISSIAYAKSLDSDEYLIPFEDGWRVATPEEALSRIEEQRP